MAKSVPSTFAGHSVLLCPYEFKCDDKGGNVAAARNTGFEYRVTFRKRRPFYFAQDKLAAALHMTDI